MYSISSCSSEPSFVTTLLKRIEIDDDQIDRLDVVRRHVFLMALIAADGQEPAENFRMQGFDAAVENFRIAGHVFDFADLDLALLQGLGGPPVEMIS